MSMLITPVCSWGKNFVWLCQQHLGAGGQLWREFVHSYTFVNFSVVRSALGRFQRCSTWPVSVLSKFPGLRRTAFLELLPRRQRSLMLPQLCPSLPCSSAKLELPSNTHVFATEDTSLHEMGMKQVCLDTYMGTWRTDAHDQSSLFLPGIPELFCRMVISWHCSENNYKFIFLMLFYPLQLSRRAKDHGHKNQVIQF